MTPLPDPTHVSELPVISPALVAWLADFRHARLSEDIREAFTEKRKLGAPVRAPWGFKFVQTPGQRFKTRLIADDKLLDFCELIARMHEAEGMSLMDVWRHCMKNKLVPKKGKGPIDYKMVSHYYRRYCRFREEQATRQKKAENS